MKIINEAGLKEIKDFLADNHILGGDYFTKDMILAWGEQANFQLAEGNPASIEIRSWDSIHGRTQDFTVSDEGVEVVEVVEFDIP